MDFQLSTSANSQIERKKLIYSSKLHGFHWLILGLSAVLTIGAWYIASEQVNKRIAERFERESLHVIELVKERMQLYEHALWGAVAHVDSSEHDITFAHWNNYASSLKIEKAYPGINGLGLIFNIKPEQLNTFLHTQQQNRPSFGIHPKHDEDEYWPITFIEPLNTNLQAVGLDMAFESNRYNGIQKSRDTGLAQLTGPIILVQDEKQTPGFLFYAPFYNKGMPHDSIDTRRENIKGVAYAPFIMSKLISGTLAVNKRHVTIKVTDDEQVLYDDSDSADAFKIDPKPLFINSIAVDFYGRNWQFTISSNLTFRESAGSNQPLLILAGGIVIDLLLFALFIFLSRANKQGLIYADTITRELKIKAARLIKSNQDLEQFAYIASHDLKSPLNAIQKLVGWITEDCESILPSASKEHLVLLNNRSKRMNRLLDDLLDYARINKFTYEPEPFDLRDMVQDIFSLLDHPNTFKLSVDSQVLSFPKVPLEIILRNLISNAIKHHHSLSGNIKILYKQECNSHCIRVIDDGPGIPIDFFEKAVEMFQTLRPRDKVEGSGMGLSLAKKIIEHYHGSLTIESDGVNGTTIVLLWPIVSEKR